MEDKLVSLNARIPESLKKRLEALAEQEDRKQEGIVRRALEAYLIANEAAPEAKL